MNSLIEGEWYERYIDAGWVPDLVLREGVRYLLSQRCKKVDETSFDELFQEKMAFIKELKELPVAIHQDKANEQHYEVPSEFIQLCLGKRMKYSSCLFTGSVKTLDDAEEAMLETYCQKAKLEDGMKILDLGCGWGSLSLFLAEKYPASEITAVSNSATQKEFIDNVAKERGFDNLTVLTRDVKDFDTELRFDRIISIEMLEHMKNYSSLFKRISSWLKDNGLFFTHVFSHKNFPYHFKTDEGNSWMARYFFTGGLMPSHDLFLYFQDDLSVVDHWFVDGVNYAKTSRAWLNKLDDNKQAAVKILSDTYGSEKEGIAWFNRWRLFYIAVEELFAYRNGNEWAVTHFLFKKK